MIRPFQIGDLLLVQRLGRQAARLNTIQSLIEPQSSFWTSLLSAFPWNYAKVATHVLCRTGHGLLGDGFLQARKRPARPEVDLLALAPALTSDTGHPAVWEKLLAYYNLDAAHAKIERIYAEVPDQPLPIATFTRAGYRIYARQTVWRLSPRRVDDYSGALSARIRPQSDADRWALSRLYTQIVPQPIQVAEGAVGDNPLPIYRWPWAGFCTPYVMERTDPRDDQDLAGAIQIVEGRRGVWFQLWADTNDPNPYAIHELLRYGLSIVHRRDIRKPVYIGVDDYRGGMNAVLSDYGFAPVSDQARLVRYVAHWVRQVQRASSRVLESTPQIAIVPYALPAQGSCRQTGPDGLGAPDAESGTPTSLHQSAAQLSATLASSLRSDGVRSDGVRSDGVRNDGVRNDGVHSDGESVMRCESAQITTRVVTRGEAGASGAHIPTSHIPTSTCGALMRQMAKQVPVL